MRITVSPEQLKFFELNGYLALEKLLTGEECIRLINAISLLRIKSPGYPDENIFRSSPLIAELARKRGWGQIAAALIHKKPLRLAYDHFWPQVPFFTQHLDPESCGCLLNLATQSGFFFKRFSLIHNLLVPQHSHLLLIFTARHLDDGRYPGIVR
jgi:hypothetical protein